MVCVAADTRVREIVSLYHACLISVADPGGVHGVHTYTPFCLGALFEKTYFENMSLVVTVFS